MATAKKLKSGSWRCLVYDYTDENGKRHYRSFTSADPSSRGKREAERMAADYAVEKEKKQDYGSRLTIKEAISGYCDLKNNVLSPSTIREYRRMQNNNYGSIENITLDRITNDIIQKWVNTFAASHNPKTVKNAYGLLRAVIDTYSPDVRLRVTMPQSISPKLYVPSDGDVKAILKYFSERDDKDMELAVYLAAFGTLRRSEICALTADDIKENTVHVSKAMVDKGGSHFVIKNTKTISSDRYIEMPELVIQRFPSQGNIVKLNLNQITGRFEEALKKLNIEKFRFHDLRHYAASIMHAIGVPDQYIMQRGGWSSDKTLKNIYRGTIEDYSRKYNDMTLSHFNDMQHKI